MTLHDPLDEHGYDDVRLAQWRAGQAAGTGFTRRDMARLTAGLSLVAGGSALEAAPAYADPTPGPIVKPLPPELFQVYGSNAEMRWGRWPGRATSCRWTGSSSATTPVLRCWTPPPAGMRVSVMVVTGMPAVLASST